MNKELFVSSTPHETKVGLVEDDLLAEVYLERENEYTLAGSIYKGRVTRVLPGMQSAFVDIGLERDAFLYVSDFMELEEHDEDVTDIVPANRGVQDLREPANAQAASGEASPTPTFDPELQAGNENSGPHSFTQGENGQVSASVDSSVESAASPGSAGGRPCDPAGRNGERGSGHGTRAPCPEPHSPPAESASGPVRRCRAPDVPRSAAAGP